MADPASPRPDGSPSRNPSTLYETLDLLPQHLALTTPGGGVVRLNRWLAELLRRVPEGRYLEDALGAYARSIAGEACGPGGAGPGEVPPMQHFRTSSGTYLLWGWCVELDHYGLGRLVLMTVQPLPPEAPPDEALRKRHGLTRKEVDVSRLLAEGRSNSGIAVALCISPHTARHHTQHIMAKLGVRSRAEVGPRLRGIPADTRRWR